MDHVVHKIHHAFSLCFCTLQVSKTKARELRPENEANFADSFQSDLVFSCSLVCSPPTVGEVQDVYGCALFSEYPVATILRDLSDVYAFEEGETPPTCAEQGPSMYGLELISFSIDSCMTEERIWVLVNQEMK